ncbi:hypothetical protein IRY61_01585 [Candidatus Saccharibacteria bacterium]|nr:hypothetical protein [Candidatus Saccharibacteria bacterium]
MAEFVRRYAGIHGIYQFGKGQFASSLKRAGFTLLEELDWTPHVKPSFDRLRRLARPLAPLTKIKQLRRYLINTFAASSYAEGAENGAFAYKVYVAKTVSR